MANLFKFKSIRSKVLFGFSIVLITVIIMSVLNYLSIQRIAESSHEVTNKELPLLVGDENLSYNMLELESLARGYFLLEDDNLKDEFFAVLDQGDQIESEILALTDAKETKEMMERKNEWQDSLADAINHYNQGHKKQAMTIMADGMDTYEKLQDEVNTLTITREDNIMESGEQSQNHANATLVFVVIITIIAILVSIVIAIITSRTISRPINLVMERMKQVSEGQLNLDPLEIKTKDETAQLTEATNQMSANNRNLLQRIKEVAETVSSQSEELTQSANEVKSGTEQTAITMQELASGAEVQANSASDLTNVMSNFTSRITNANQQSELVQESSDDVAEMTVNGRELMRSSSEQMSVINHLVKDSVVKMKQLDQHSQDVSQLVSVINDIADQTNLLALNAAIEAARAGENGRGFAVVADEVRKLAEQVGHSIKDITAIVSSIQEESKNVSAALESGFQEVEQGTEQIQTTEETFNQISERVDSMATQIQTISVDLTEIVASNEEMGASIEEIASVSEESAAGVEETAASAQQASDAMEEVAGSSNDLAALAEEMNQLVAQYKV